MGGLSVLVPSSVAAVEICARRDKVVFNQSALGDWYGISLPTASCGALTRSLLFKPGGIARPIS
jgi:hypothetical protein